MPDEDALRSTEPVVLVWPVVPVLRGVSLASLLRPLSVRLEALLLVRALSVRSAVSLLRLDDWRSTWLELVLELGLSLLVLELLDVVEPARAAWSESMVRFAFRSAVDDEVELLDLVPGTVELEVLEVVPGIIELELAPGRMQLASTSVPSQVRLAAALAALLGDACVSVGEVD